MALEEMEKRLKATQEALKDLEKRVRVTEDIQEIHQLQRRYVNALICTEWDDCADCFAEDAKIDVYLHDPVKGKAAITKWFKEELSVTHAGKEGDIVVHPIISVDGDKAKGKWLLYMMYAYPRTGQSLFWVQGFYDMEYVRENGTWKISLMKWTERMGLPGGGPPTGLF
jgi:ketosteroid isomerase-like protein